METIERLGVVDEVKSICLRHGAFIEELPTLGRMKHVAEARAEVMLFIRNKFEWSYPAIGRLFGGRDHTTVMSACKKAEAGR